MCFRRKELRTFYGIYFPSLLKKFGQTAFIPLEYSLLGSKLLLTSLLKSLVKIEYEFLHVEDAPREFHLNVFSTVATHCSSHSAITAV